MDDESITQYFFSYECNLIQVIYIFLIDFWDENLEKKPLNGLVQRVKNATSFRLINQKIMTVFLPFKIHFQKLCRLGFITPLEGIELDPRTTYSLYIDGIQKHWAEKMVFEDEQSIFLEGPAGTGKTHTVEQILSKLRTEKGFSILNTSTTGCSALLLEEGATVDSAFGHGLRQYMDKKKPNEYRDPVSYGYFIANILMNSTMNRTIEKVEKIKKSQVIRIDEISMMSATDFTYFSTVVSKICGNFSAPFGGKILMLTGDLFQLPPIPSYYGPDGKSIVPGTDKYFIESDTWKKAKIKTFSLSFSYRQLEDRRYALILDRMRFGRNIPEDIEVLSGRVIKTAGERKKLMDDTSIIKIFARNKEVDDLNSRALDSINEEPEDIPIVTEILKDQKDIDVMISAHIKSLNLQDLRLKKGCRIMITFNQDLGRGIVNGRTGVYQGMGVRNMKILLDGDKLPVGIKRTEYSYKNAKGKEIYKILQFPVRLGYAITVHKSQGASLAKVIAKTDDLRGEGCAYVLFSRVSKLENIHLLNFSKAKIQVNKEMVNMFAPKFPSAFRQKVSDDDSNGRWRRCPDDEFLKCSLDSYEKLKEKLGDNGGGNDVNMNVHSPTKKLKLEVIELD